MRRLVLPLVAVILAIAVAYTEASCCGRGVHGFCKDCSVVRSVFSRGQKCCGSGSGRGKGCNLFCCSCGTCRAGKPEITFKSGWWFHKKYTCTKKDAESEEDLKDLLVTQEVFKELDKDGDKVLSPDEFLTGLRAHMNKDFESSYSMASDLVQSDDREEVMSLLDVAQSDNDLHDDVVDEIANMAKEEFEKMDADGDGLIQAQEFDEDLK